MTRPQITIGPGTGDVIRHYDRLLAEHYTWMSGISFDQKVSEQEGLLRQLGLAGGGTAIDLGCGPGYQSFALARLGFDPVFAVDTSEMLLAELTNAKHEERIVTLHSDLRQLARLVAPEEASAVLCMGDTLTHLPDFGDVAAMLGNAQCVLRSGGWLVVSYRDLSQPLTGLDRIFDVRSDNDRIMTCLLDYGPETVVVTDLIHQREAGGWTLHKSSYRKLRIARETLVGEMAHAGLRVVEVISVGGLDVIVARKP